MSFVTNHRVNDKPVNNFFEKVPTQGDADGFSAEAPGRRAIKDLPQGSDLTNIEAPFSYLVGQNQLQLFWWFGGQSKWELLLERSTYEAAGMMSETLPYYEETSTGTIALYNIGSLDSSAVAPLSGDFQGGKLLFSVPHTALPGSARNRLVVENQGDNVGIELQGRGDGITFTTPQGRTYLIRPEEDGILTTIPLN